MFKDRQLQARRKKGVHVPFRRNLYCSCGSVRKNVKTLLIRNLSELCALSIPLDGPTKIFYIHFPKEGILMKRKSLPSVCHHCVLIAILHNLQTLPLHNQGKDWFLLKATPCLKLEESEIQHIVISLGAIFRKYVTNITSLSWYSKQVRTALNSK